MLPLHGDPGALALGPNWHHPHGEDVIGDGNIAEQRGSGVVSCVGEVADVEGIERLELSLVARDADLDVHGADALIVCIDNSVNENSVPHIHASIVEPVAIKVQRGFHADAAAAPGISHYGRK